MAERSEKVPYEWVMKSPLMYVVAHGMTLIAAVLLCGALSEITVQKTIITFIALSTLRFASRADTAKMGWSIVQFIEKIR